MFHIHHSHSLKKLASSFGDIFEPDLSDPLDPSWVIIQNNEIKEWLSLALAKEKGIAANFRFIFPSEFLWTLYRLKEKDLPQALPTDLQAMQWTIFELLTNDAQLLKQVPSYDHESDDINKRFQFSAQLADNFDQYQVYRPDMMEQWLDRKLVTKRKEEQWQFKIWNRLNEKWKRNEPTKWLPRRSQAFLELLSLLENDTQLISKIPENIYVFGLSHAQAPFLKIISKVAKVKNVHFFQRRSKVEGIEENFVKLAEAWKKPESEQLLLLKNILNDDGVEYEETELKTAPITLPKLEVHSCHNRRREVQVLKNGLLQFLDDHPEHSVSDCLIMVPEADVYSGILEVVFENNKGEPGLPLSRLSRRGQVSFEHTLVELLQLLAGSFKASSVLEFLNLDPVRAKFSFTESDVELLEHWVLENKIHWGVGEDFNTPFSWEKGLSQLMAGFSMEPDPLDVFHHIVPFTNINSTEDAELAAKFHRFLAVLKQAAESIQQNFKVGKWLKLTEKWVQQFMEEPSERSPSRSGLIKRIHRLGDQIAYTSNSEKLPFSLIRNWLIGQLESHNSNSGRFGQGVTVSSYIPYRAVPFEYIAVLGMNEGVFPRKAIRPDHDLIYADPKPGDRILKEDDTYLFLETLQAAGKQFHISYQGQDQRSDSRKLPSILIQQLLEVLYQEPESVIHEHSLHPFNKKNYNGSLGYSYSKSDLEVLKGLKAEKENNEALNYIDSKWKSSTSSRGELVQISDLISFFVQPAKYFVENELDIRNYEDLHEIDDREQFKLKGIERYSLDHLLFHSLASGNHSSQVYDYAKAAGMLPESIEGEKAFQKEKKSIQELLKVLEIEADKEEMKVEIETAISGVDLYGVIDGIYDKKLVSYRVGKRRAKHEIAHWIKHLILINAGTDISESLFLSKDKEALEICRIPSSGIKKETLSKYFKWFQKKQKYTDKLAFSPESSKAYAEEYLKSSDPEKARTKAMIKWKGNRFSSFDESSDYYNHLVWRNQDPILKDAFHDLALLFWEPFLNAMEEDE